MMNCNIKLTFVINTQLHLYTGISARRTRALHAQMIHSRYVRIYEYDVGCYTFQLHVLYCKNIKVRKYCVGMYMMMTIILRVWIRYVSEYWNCIICICICLYVFITHSACYDISMTHPCEMKTGRSTCQHHGIEQQDENIACMYMKNKNRGPSVVCTYNRENLWE